MDFQYVTAQDLDTAWLNFEPDIPLRPGPRGELNRFYVTRPQPDNTLARLENALVRPYQIPPKYYFSGHRGCGKSTELYRLAASPHIQQKFWPVHFSVRELADINDLDFKDILLLIGGQLFNQYQEKGSKKLDDQLLKELDEWQGQIEIQRTTLQEGRLSGELGAKISTVFAELNNKIRLEPKTRQEIRQHFDRNITGLIEVINTIATAITAKEQKPPLVLIDDLDKPDLAIARSIFYERGSILQRPNCPIVYTVSSPLFYSPEFSAIRGQAFFLPNVKLHPQGQSQERDSQGYYTMRMFALYRMRQELITDEALDLAATMSGGVFREMAYIMRGAIDQALAAGRAVIEQEDVRRAAAEIRASYWRILTGEQRQLLQSIREHNIVEDPEKIGTLLQLLAVLEYQNGEPWYDVHPVLHKMLDDLAA